MSAQAGVYYPHHQPGRAELLDRLYRSLERQGPDGGATRQAGAVGMAYRACQITPESVHEMQPIQGYDGCLFTFDGRLDNREDLIFQLKEALLGDRTDAAIAFAAFARWGAKCFGRLVGDWAIAAWEQHSETMFLARDFAGACPLYYFALGPEVLLWSSELEGLAELAAVVSGSCLQIDEEWIAQYFGLQPDGERTPFRGIKHVPPGCFVVITETAVSVQRHWAIDPEFSIHYRTDAEYEEHFRELFRQAVRCRLRSRGPVWGQLSGGMDSSAIVCMADHILEHEGADISGLETVTATYDQSPESDERKFFMEIERKRGRGGHHFDEFDYPFLTLPFYGHRTGMPEHADCYARREQAICSAMEASGSRVQLCGQGGDELLGNIGAGHLSLLDSLYHGRFDQFRQELIDWAIATRRSRMGLFSEVVQSALPHGLQTLLDRSPEVGQHLRMLDHSFVSRQHLRTRVVPTLTDPFELTLPSGQRRASGLHSVIVGVCRTILRRMGPAHVTYPYLHRPLVSFLLSIPMSQLARPGERRSLMRRALRGLLPEGVLRRKTKQSPDAALYRALARELPAMTALLDQPVVCELGYIRRTELQQVLRECCHGIFPVVLLCKVLCLEVWLRSQTTTLGISPRSGTFSPADSLEVSPFCGGLE